MSLMKIYVQNKSSTKKNKFIYKVKTKPLKLCRIIYILCTKTHYIKVEQLTVQ